MDIFNKKKLLCGTGSTAPCSSFVRFTQNPQDNSNGKTVDIYTGSQTVAATFSCCSNPDSCTAVTETLPICAVPPPSPSPSPPPDSPSGSLPYQIPTPSLTPPPTAEAAGHGDVHFASWDGFLFDFHGYGEFVYLVSDYVRVHGRQRTIASDGTCDNIQPGVTPTYTFGIAVSAVSVSGTRVNISVISTDSGKVVVIYSRQGNKYATYIMPAKKITVDSSISIVTPQDMISGTITISVSNELVLSVHGNNIAGNLDWTISARRTHYFNNTMGILGTYTGTTFDDFMAPNGTITERPGATKTEIYANFGLKWQIINSSESIFYYAVGDSFEQHNCPSYVPYSSGRNNLTSETQLQFYNNYCITNLPSTVYEQCMDELVLTGIHSTYPIADRIKSVASFSSFTINQVVLYNPLPVFYLDNSNTIYFVPDTVTVISMAAFDPRNLYLQYSLLHGPKNSSLNSTTGLFQWFPTNRDTSYVNISVSNGHSVVTLAVSLLPVPPSSAPSTTPTLSPTLEPSNSPTYLNTALPSFLPSIKLSTPPIAPPTSHPSGPTSEPSSNPSRPTSRPLSSPSRQPTRTPKSKPTRQPFLHKPTSQPSNQPRFLPSGQPLVLPSRQPIPWPRNKPSHQPSHRPSSQPIYHPSKQPNGIPSLQPTLLPLKHPSSQPLVSPSRRPSEQPYHSPFLQPSHQPTSQPSERPFIKPSSQPFCTPTSQPNDLPSQYPLELPSDQPFTRPSTRPRMVPSYQPSHSPSRPPSHLPSEQPRYQPSFQPFRKPSIKPSHQPNSTPSSRPLRHPSTQPSINPTVIPFDRYPSYQPTQQPTAQPIARPSKNPNHFPSRIPSSQPSSVPSPLTRLLESISLNNIALSSLSAEAIIILKQSVRAAVANVTSIPITFTSQPDLKSLPSPNVIRNALMNSALHSGIVATCTIIGTSTLIYTALQVQSNFSGSGDDVIATICSSKLNAHNGSILLEAIRREVVIGANASSSVVNLRMSLANVTTAGVTVVAVSPTLAPSTGAPLATVAPSSPSVSRNQSPTLSIGGYAGIVVGGAFVLIVICFCYLRRSDYIFTKVVPEDNTASNEVVYFDDAVV